MNKLWIKKVIIGLLCICITGCNQQAEDKRDIIQIGNYKNISVEKQKIDVSDKEIKEEMEGELMQYAEMREVTERGIQQGDIAYIHYVAKTQNKQEDVGETLKFTIDFGNNVDFENWSNQTINFIVDIYKMEETILPEVTDEFVRKNYDLDNVKAFEDYIRDIVYACKERLLQAEIKENVMKEVISDTTFGESFEEQCEERFQEVKESYKKYANAYGITYEETLQNFNVSEKILYEQAVYDEGCWQICNLLLNKKK